MNEMVEPVQAQATLAARKFPTPDTHLAKILTDAHFRQTFHAQLKRYNPLMVALYQVGLLPLFGLSRSVMLLTTRGRKSGKRRSTPIGYVRIGGVVHLFSAWGRRTAWYQNLTACPEDVWIQIGLRKWPVQAECLTERAEIERTLEQLVSESPAQAQTFFGWQPGVDQLDQADFSEVIERVLIVRFTPRPA